MAKIKKVKIPKSVLDLRMSPKKFAKKNDIRLKGKGMSKKEKKYNLKRLKDEYSQFAIEGLNTAVKIIAEVPEHKKIDKVKDGVENIITNPAVMKRIAKIYKKHPDQYHNMIFMPYIIMNTLMYYKRDDLDEDEKETAEQLDTDSLVSFCEKILKKRIKRYKKVGLDNGEAFQMATAIPTSKLFKNGNRSWYRRLINQMYDLARDNEVNVETIMRGAMKVDKKKYINKKDFLQGFFSEFIMQKSSNKTAKFTENQKRLHEDLTDKALVYLNSLKPKKLREILKGYIHRRKDAEKHNKDGKRVIKFTEHANSNSPYDTIKKVVQGLIEDNSENELYLG